MFWARSDINIWGLYCLLHTCEFTFYLSPSDWMKITKNVMPIYDPTNAETRVTLFYPFITFVFLLEPSRFSLGLLVAPSTFVRAGSVFCLLLGFSTSCCLPWTLPIRSLGEPSTEGFALPWFLPSCSLEELSVVPEDVDGFFLLLLNLPRIVNSIFVLFYVEPAQNSG